jgi:hypothetical protein
MKRMASGKKKSSASGTSTKRQKRSTESRFVVCVSNREYPASLELHKIYRVIPDKDAESEGDIRVVDESGEDYLFPAKWFVPVKIPQAVKSSLLRAS